MPQTISNSQRLEALCRVLSEAANVISMAPHEAPVDAAEYGLTRFYADDARLQVRAIIEEVERHEEATGLAEEYDGLAA